MSTEILIDKERSEDKVYLDILNQLEHFIDSNDKLISSLSNFTALLNESISKISWVGFYIKKDDKLFLGPFQGKSACTEIAIGRGVCGITAQKRVTMIVDDVKNFHDHIACDSSSRSEIVVPIAINEKIWGVLDIDSYELSAFDEIDKYYLEQFCKFLVKRLDLNSYFVV